MQAAQETPIAAPENPFNLPDGEENQYDAYRIEFAKQSRVLVLSDIHIPYHSVASLTAAIEEGKRQEIDTILLNGDTIDCYQLSRWEKDPRKRHFKDEVTATKDFLTRLREIFPKARIVWKDGNHDERLQKYLVANAPAIFDLNIATYPALLDFCGLRVDYVTDKRPIRLGKLTVLHGHEFPNAMLGPVNPARGLFLRAKDSCLAGHWHQTSEHSEPTIQEKLIATWSTGCLCDLHPEYMPLNKWNHGFATVEVAPSGDFEVRNRRVHRGRLL